MTLLRRSTNPGRRERAARRRQRRTITTLYAGDGSDPVTLKLGRKHRARKLWKHLAVADSRKTYKSKTCD